jgi:hypothetical protein
VNWLDFLIISACALAVALVAGVIRCLIDPLLPSNGTDADGP